MHIRHKHHVYSDYLILFLILAVGLISFTKMTGTPAKQVSIAMITAISYSLWGIFHHVHEGDLHIKIVVEYASLAFFGFVAMLALLWLFA